MGATAIASSAALAALVLLSAAVQAQTPPAASRVNPDRFTRPPPTVYQPVDPPAVRAPEAPPATPQLTAPANVGVISRFVKVSLTVERVDPEAPIERSNMVVAYRLSNPSQTNALRGKVSATFQGQQLTGTDGSPPPEVSLAPGASIAGQLMTKIPLVPGTSPLALFFTDADACGLPVGAIRPRCTVWDGGVQDIRVDSDGDVDGVSDRVERELLAKYTPYLKFSKDGEPEKYAPTDALTYIRSSALQTTDVEGKSILLSVSALQNNPGQLLANGNDARAPGQGRFRSGERYLDPLDEAPRRGQPWPDVLAKRNVGLYGHVVSFLNTPLNAPPSTRRQLSVSDCLGHTDGNEAPGCKLDSSKSYYKIEYWQFFGYNDTGQGGALNVGDHEGDWCTVQIFVDRSSGAIAEVDMYFHGRKAGYITGGFGEQTLDLEGGQIRQFYHGSVGDLSYTWNSGPVADTQNKTSGALAQNRVVRLFRDPVSGEYTHPVVYVEHGGHEFWPTESWSYAQAPKHGGDDRDHSYLASAPPNLGELEHPLGEAAGAELVLAYNGHWGAYNQSNSPPQGPTLHKQWMWPRWPALAIEQASY